MSIKQHQHNFSWWWYNISFDVPFEEFINKETVVYPPLFGDGMLGAWKGSIQQPNIPPLTFENKEWRDVLP